MCTPFAQKSEQPVCGISCRRDTMVRRTRSDRASRAQTPVTTSVGENPITVSRLAIDRQPANGLARRSSRVECVSASIPESARGIQHWSPVRSPSGARCATAFFYRIAAPPVAAFPIAARFPPAMHSRWRSRHASRRRMMTPLPSAHRTPGEDPQRPRPRQHGAEGRAVESCSASTWAHSPTISEASRTSSTSCVR